MQESPDGCQQALGLAGRATVEVMIGLLAALLIAVIIDAVTGAAGSRHTTSVKDAA
jgi:hypothetical protein